MRAVKIAGAAAAILAICWGEAVAAPPVVCVRNTTGADLDVVIDVKEDAPDRPGHYRGTVAPRSGSCEWSDVDYINIFFRRAAALPPSAGGDYRTVSTAAGGWKACPTYSSSDGRYVYTIRRGLLGLTCKTGGNADGLEGEGEYE